MKEIFTTRIAQGKIELNEKFQRSFQNWLKFEKTLDPQGVSNTTTKNGWQKSFSTSDAVPEWHTMIAGNLVEIRSSLNSDRIQSSWVIEYSQGGYQDLHMHLRNGCNWTVIINLTGEGEVLLHDPRPIYTANTGSYIEEIKLLPGDWLALPSWLIHSSRPSQGPRSIYVMDVR